ncbi:hypothetical protein [Stackebrandtia nassauensis]|uniref:Uncharacterized protein n=1 Tax=Stackebrandtia nassauensis (strain DSM 44728 / CIP 108903 / NRRL B-16338 / NBRC 102104 / LLR-40K-21) TaxID=446470 RepID=D3Q2B4_STANL|nr:hypothetical protein [Stackebrandtia nassauensis]ADD43847.1 hypothetical protein Snas_4197 [Stackebrandtia nassauensis DSM 44728]
MPEDHKAPLDHEQENTEEVPEPTNRAERRAMKKGKGRNKVKGVGIGSSQSGFHPKDVKTAGHKEFTNRKTG